MSCCQPSPKSYSYRNLTFRSPLTTSLRRTPSSSSYLHVHLEAEVVGGRWAVGGAPDDELVQVGVGPSHRDLDHLVEITQRAVGDLDPTPDRRLDVLERDLELVDPVGLLGGLAAGPDRLGFFEGVQEVFELAVDGLQPLLVGARGEAQRGVHLLGRLFEFLPGEPDGLGALGGLTDLVLQPTPQPSGRDQGFPLLVREFEGVLVLALLGLGGHRQDQGRFARQEVEDGFDDAARLAPLRWLPVPVEEAVDLLVEPVQLPPELLVLGVIRRSRHVACEVVQFVEGEHQRLARRRGPDGLLDLPGDEDEAHEEQIPLGLRQLEADLLAGPDASLPRHRRPHLARWIGRLGSAMMRRPSPGIGRPPDAKARSMPQSIPKGLTTEHVLKALADLDTGAEHPFGSPTGYELVHGGHRYPPKAVIGLAFRHHHGPGPYARGVQRRRGPRPGQLRAPGTRVLRRGEGLGGVTRRSRRRPR